MCSVHSGTHVDAPAHFFENGATVEQLPLDVLIGKATVVEILELDLLFAAGEGCDEDEATA